MNTKERFIAALENQRADRLPVTTHHIIPSFLDSHSDIEILAKYMTCLNWVVMTILEDIVRALKVYSSAVV